jgi:hypothetical protein
VAPAELHVFFEDLVRKLRDQGVVCAITSGLACVHYGVAETTQDCDLLCHPKSFDELLKLLSLTDISGAKCSYRGNISPPLDLRWHRGGWTSHFEWKTPAPVVTLDVFGHALRESTPWGQEVLGLYAGAQTVAEMKRTNRDKDWAFITALGVRMIQADDDRGWLHIFSADELKKLLRSRTCPPDIAKLRPALQMALNRDAHTAGALNAERKFWEELDRLRIHILERHLRPYVSAVRKTRRTRTLSLEAEHVLRVDCARQHLPENPLREYGVEKYIADAKQNLAVRKFLPEEALTWLPDVTIYFSWLKT